MKNAKIQEENKGIQERIDLIRDRRSNFFPAYERQLLDTYLEYKGNIRVFIRSRPILPNDFKAYDLSKEDSERL